jgi:transcriptional regulator with XRE-family HTH domain
MADFKTANTVGARISALRKARGFASAKALAEEIPGDSITESILQNIEAGRKNDLAVAQLLNLAWALKVSPLFILAPLGSPHENLDLPNIVPDVQKLTVGEFDAWISGIDGIYRPMTAAEHSERTQLEALRELLRARREAHRLTVVIELETESPGDAAATDGAPSWTNTQQRLDDTNRQIAQLEAYLGTGGWNISRNGLEQ